jgi:tRNA-specific 2-thiouridylase
VDLPTFLQQQLKPKKGFVVEIPTDYPAYLDFDPGNTDPEYLSAGWKYGSEDGKIIGSHNGAHFYTVGQRKGLNIGGKKEPLFIIGTDTDKNIIYAGEGKDHPGLYRMGLRIPDTDVHWVRDDMILSEGSSGEYDVRIRYRQELQKARLHMKKNYLYIIFEQAQRGITPGQFAAWYRKDEVIGSGVIE